MATDTLDNRVTRLETAYEYLATKADVAELRADMERLHSSAIKWMIGLIAASVIANASLVLGLLRIVGQ